MAFETAVEKVLAQPLLLDQKPQNSLCREEMKVQVRQDRPSGWWEPQCSLGPSSFLCHGWMAARWLTQLPSVPRLPSLSSVWSKQLCLQLHLQAFPARWKELVPHPRPRRLCPPRLGAGMSSRGFFPVCEMGVMTVTRRVIMTAPWRK